MGKGLLRPPDDLHDTVSPFKILNSKSLILHELHRHVVILHELHRNVVERRSHLKLVEPCKAAFGQASVKDSASKTSSSQVRHMHHGISCSDVRLEVQDE